MPRNILILNGHPDPASRGLCYALAEAYATGAREAGHDVRRLDVAGLTFAWLHSQTEFEKGAAPPAILEAQQDLLWAHHLVVVFPLWLGDMPAVLKAFFEQALRPGFAFDYRPSGFPSRRLSGRSARIIVTMGMPALVYRWYFGAHGLKNLARNVLGFVGYSPVRKTVLGSIVTRGEESIHRALAEVKVLGRRGR